MPRVRMLTQLALLLAGALVLFVVEGWLPPLFPAVPGVKLGLSNMIGLFVLKRYGVKQALFITGLKCVMGGLLGGNPIGMIYSLAGGLLSMGGMATLYSLLKSHVSLYGVSIVGAALHHVGQLTVAWLMVGQAGVFGYLPIMTALAIPTGLFIGLCANLMARYVPEPPKTT